MQCIKKQIVSVIGSINKPNSNSLNPFMPNVFSHHYQLDESISNLRVVGKYVSIPFKF